MAYTPYLILFVAICCEVLATSLLPLTQQFTRPLPTLGMALFYAVSFWLLTLVLRSIPLGVAYAIWSGMGIVLVAIVGMIVFNQRLDLPALIGIAMIIGGVLVVNLFSRSVGH